jgi:hypothetical protein
MAGARLIEGSPAMMAALEKFRDACAKNEFLTSAGLTVVVTEIRRPDIVQARYFCHGRTVDEIAADLDHRETDQNTRALMGLAIQETFGAEAMPEDRAPGRIITNALPYAGPHCLGVAMHFRVKKGRRILPDDQTPWEHVGKIAKSCGFVWGGNWKMRDMEHLELPRQFWPKPALPEAA